MYKGSGEPFRLNWYRFSGGKTGVKTSGLPNDLMNKSQSRRLLSVDNKAGISGRNHVHDISGRAVGKQGFTGKRADGVYIDKAASGR